MHVALAPTLNPMLGIAGWDSKSIGSGAAVGAAGCLSRVSLAVPPFLAVARGEEGPLGPP